ncbi:hypothetical protein EYZ11_005624 [Aspergillus tanneri]|uniref:Sulfhydryl oxidase n=1 Tax=Aspergillus tanneri TaxID=1220188 RepID=A0A4S3JHT0_9EURO|nr:uncharacterized protein ATNIH1004_011020 [Aspergillus tanneri]KAA8642079.1 hypothetical protein ATNIH1004_011020 [Aspergillus tanneri]THC94902.1 hypothetical protein EYZ11_005624 [Aspergillus tanneri]
MANRQITRRILIGAAIATVLLVFFHIRPQAPSSRIVRAPSHLQTPTDVTQGEVIMPRLGNDTAKAELGRATWKYFHTMLARYPEKPTKEQQETLRTYIYLFAQLYPCGECATHFQGHLAKYPPQVSSRNAAAGWGCFMHNEVNAMLEKPEFDCNKIGDFYDCGCADDGTPGNGKDGLRSGNQDTSREIADVNDVVLPV